MLDLFSQVSQALINDLSSTTDNNNELQLHRRNSNKVAQMLQEILQRGEVQIEPYHIQRFLHRLIRHETINPQKDKSSEYIIY